MNGRRSPRVLALGIAAWLGAVVIVLPQTRQRDTLPARLSNAEFWRLSTSLSEPNGYFRSDNLLSNEIYFQYQVPDLVARARQGGVYLGVGPEQNFTYIAALKPKIVFITDIRRGNLWTQLMYKALFELSETRAEFVSRLLSRPRPEGLGADAAPAALFAAFSAARPDPALYAANLKAIKEMLTEKHGFKRALVPRANAPRRPLGIEVVPVDRLSEALAVARSS